MNNVFKKVGAKIVKHSPEIFAGVGVVGVLAGVVLACKATTKVEEIVKETKKDIDEIEKVIKDKKYQGKYSEEDAQKDRIIIGVRAAKKFIKLYWLPAVLVVGGLTFLLKSNGILRERNTYLMTSLVGLKETFEQYKKNVIEKYGIDAHNELLLNSNGEFITETIIDPETNKKKKIKHAVHTGYLSEYGFVFNEDCRSYDQHYTYNLTFIKLAEQWINQKLVANGFVYLDELYNHFGIYDRMDPVTKKKYLALGHTFGWVYMPNNEKVSNYISIKSKDVYLTKDGYDLSEYGCDPVLVIDFEPDGPVNHFL